MNGTPRGMHEPRIAPAVSIVIPTFRRERVLLDTIAHVRALRGPPHEIIVVDQTPTHEPDTTSALTALAAAGDIRWVRLEQPSITHAMNVGLEAAGGDVVLFLDDDVVPDTDLLSAHAAAHAAGSHIVAGRVLQPWDDPLASDDPASFRFSSRRRQWIREVMGGNLSVSRSLARRLGGFDENFVRVAYRFEAEFAARALAAGERILFEPAATLRHLKVPSGGTRSFGDHLRTAGPGHTVGAYYHLMRARNEPGRLRQILLRPLRAVRTRHHALHPWWIPATLLAELLGFAWALCLSVRGPRLLSMSAIGSPHD